MSFPVNVPVTDRPAIDFTSQMLTRLVTQYQPSPGFIKLLQVYLMELQEIEQVIQDMWVLLNVDTAVGDQLRIIGDIVGQQQVYIDENLQPYFGFTDVCGYVGFYDIAGGVWRDQPTLFGFADVCGYIGFYDIEGGVWAVNPDGGGGLIPLTDDQYRALIRAKIFKNQSGFTLPDMELLAQYAFQDPGAFATIPEPLVTDVCFSRPLAGWEIALLEEVFNTKTNKQIIPPPMGTSIVYCYYPTGKPFGFVDLGYYGFADIDGGEWSIPID